MRRFGDDCNVFFRCRLSVVVLPASQLCWCPWQRAHGLTRNSEALSRFRKKTPIFLRTPLNPECDQPIKQRPISAVWSHGRAAALLTCRSHQLWFLPPAANCRQRFNREQRSCLLTLSTRSALTDGRCDGPCHCSLMQIDNFSPSVSLTRP